jgi:hypothetical protein
MIRKLILVVFLQLFPSCFGQDKNFYGNYLGCGYWGMNYYKIKRSNKVVWYSNGCTVRFRKQTGSWISNIDTIEMSFEKKQIKYILKDGALCYYSTNGSHGEAINGLPETNRFTLNGALKTCRKKRKRNVH